MKSKVLSIFLCVMLFCNLAISTTFAAEPTAITYDVKSYVTVTGTVDAKNAGYDASLMLVKKGANLSNLTINDIGYIGQEEINAEGKYLFEFTFSGFTYSQNIVDNYNIILNVNGVEMTPSITKAVAMSDIISFDLDFTQFGKSIAEITNNYGLKDFNYTAMVAFYNADGELLGVKKAERFAGDDPNFTYGYKDMPEGTAYARGFIWDSMERMIPLANSDETIDVLTHSIDREVMTLSIAPGKDETERNFAWYDLPGVEDVKIQIAEKVTGTTSDFEGSSAQTFAGTSGEVEAAKFNGTPLNSANPNTLFSYQGEYSWGRATVTGLQPGKEYVYRIGDKFGWLKGVYSFKTDENPDEGFEFLVVTDEHFGDNVAYDNAVINTTAKAFETVPNASMIFALGDNVDFPWHETAYTKYFSREYTKSIPLATVPGPTHDMLINPNEATLFGYHFNMPNQSNTSGYIKDVCGNYWYTYGDVLFIGLTNNWLSQSSVATNAAFVEDAIKSNPNAKWKILYAHLPFGTAGGGNPTDSFLTTYGDFIADNGIDVAMCGHLHYYYRTHQMKDGEVVTETPESGVIENPTAPIYMSFNTACSRSGAIPAKQDYMAFADTNAVYGFYTGKAFTSDFTAIKVVTTDDETSLEIKTYQNTVAPSTSNFEITDTKVLDTVKLTKTVEAQ